jgi:hypothetical protein
VELVTEWYVKLYVRSYSAGLRRVHKEKTEKRLCEPDAVFSQVFRCQMECQNDLLEVGSSLGCKCYQQN